MASAATSPPPSSGKAGPVPENAPEECPGTAAETAGAADACQGCPNQTACATAPKGPDPDVGAITDRLSTVKRKVLVLSGKGGVGKSTVTTTLAHALARHELQVGLMDIDICGPSVPKMLGLTGHRVKPAAAGWEPVYVADNLAVMSVGFMLESEDDAVIWRGPKKNGLIKQFLKDVDWGYLDYMLVDTPPGTSDEHLSIAQYLRATDGVEGAVIVTTPQEVALLDVRKEINFCHKVGLPILGVIENMSGFVCPGCDNTTQIFAPSTGGAAAMAKEMNIPYLGALPLDPALRKAADSGSSYAAALEASSPTLNAINDVVAKLFPALADVPLRTDDDDDDDDDEDEDDDNVQVVDAQPTATPTPAPGVAPASVAVPASGEAPVTPVTPSARGGVAGLASVLGGAPPVGATVIQRGVQQ